MKEFKHTGLTERIIMAFYDVYNKLGFGFLEKVYENAMEIELRKKGLTAESQKPVQVLYDGNIIGDYCMDIVVEENVIVEIKAVKSLNAEHDAQLLNYLKASQIEVGLLLNFGPKPEVKRRVFGNSRKQAGVLSDKKGV
ncbi:MAG TPA: GxxExxY protein [Nitrospiraceae bacterium]|nr:GxxExxY protein [Nitrospiraceae bacterium]